MTFGQFFRALWDRDPFPWQEALAERVLRGDWPRIGLPTASGKTALIDIAVYALAMRAPGAARRIFFVVDRRVIVDEAAERAARIARKLAEAAPGSDLGRLAQSLRELGGQVPLDTAVLRGGISRDDSWAGSPLQPIVVCSTVDQIGSSLLFRAYGTSEYGRPIRAGLAAYDSLILLDEAHTSRAFAQTLGFIRRYRDWADAPLELPFTFVEMSATPCGDALRENADDLDHEVLKRRWQASKRTRLVAVEPKEGEDAAKGGLTALVEALVGEARALRDQHGAKVIGVIANRVRTARQVHNALAKDDGCDAILLIGRSRPYDRDRIWREWKDMIGLDRKTEPEKPVFVVATQCIEVGTNLDFDGLVTELASVDALEQRFGRLDRDGRHAEAAGATHAAVVAQKDQTAKKYDDVLYGGAMTATWAWLADHITTETRVEELPVEGRKKPKTRKVKEQFVEMGVRALRNALDATAGRESLRMPAQAAPVLTPAHVDLLSQTSPEPEISPEPSVYLHGPEAGPADVHVVWRADLGDDPANWRDAAAMCPPNSAEMMSVPLYVVKQWLMATATADIADVEGHFGEAGRTRGAMRRVLCWRGVDESETVDRPEQLLPGMTIVVPAEYGACDDWGWNPDFKEETRDIGDPVKLLMDRPMLRLHRELARKWKYERLAERLRAPDHPDLEQVIQESPPDADADPWVADALRALREAKRRLKWIGDPECDGYIAVASRTVFDQNDVRGSYGSVEIPLAEHMKNCASVAAEFGRELPERLRHTIVRAAEAHDIGKADPRFQAWLRGGNPAKSGELVAKSSRSGQNRAAIERARRLAGYPKGGRHELMSTALLAQDGDRPGDVDQDLLLHLVASHHGRCRPFAPVVPDNDPVVVTYDGTSGSSSHGLERVGSGVSERFWRLTRRYGWYGLAYLEAIVRLADQRQSEAEQTKWGMAAHV
jgi:CRISPR-associated endonuclease/helicase Cas3